MVNNDNHGNKVEQFLIGKPEQIVYLNCYLKRGWSLHQGGAMGCEGDVINTQGVCT